MENERISYKALKCYRHIRKYQPVELQDSCLMSMITWLGL